MIDDELLPLTKQACLKISATDNGVDIKHTFRLGNQSTLGVIFILFGGLFLIIVPFIKSSDTTSKIIGIALGGLLLMFSIFTLIRQVSDRLQIKDKTLTFRYDLKRTTILVSSSMKINTKIAVIKPILPPRLGAGFITVTFFLNHPQQSTPILKFQMDNKYANDAKKLGSKLTQIINSKCQQQ